MKTPAEIATDCGLTSPNLIAEFDRIIRKEGRTAFNEYEQGMHEIIKALYRRVEKLDATTHHNAKLVAALDEIERLTTLYSESSLSFGVVRKKAADALAPQHDDNYMIDGELMRYDIDADSFIAAAGRKIHRIDTEFIGWKGVR